MSSIVNGELILGAEEKNASGGTELLARRLIKKMGDELKGSQIHISRVNTPIYSNLKQIYWVHDIPGDPAMDHLKNGGWRKFNKVVFVSNWQQQYTNSVYGLPYERGVVIRNTIEPMPARPARGNKPIDLVYFSTPHRGLHIAYHAFQNLYEQYGDMIRFKVFSSYEIYGWAERNEPYEPLYKELMNHPGVLYSQSVSNEKIRQAILECDILAYPSTWIETSCLTLIESMCAGLHCVHSNLGALPETSLGMTDMYGYRENDYDHSNIFQEKLALAIEKVYKGVVPDSSRANEYYDWNQTVPAWKSVIG